MRINQNWGSISSSLSVCEGHKAIFHLYTIYSKPYLSPAIMCSLEQLSYVCYTKINQNVIKIVNHLRACEGRMCSLSYVCLGWDNSAAQSRNRCFSHSQNLMLWKKFSKSNALKNILKVQCSERRRRKSICSIYGESSSALIQK